MPTRVGLESYEVMACHGAYDFEREKKQPFVISIWATLASDVIEDELEQTLNYADLQSAVDSEIVNSEPVKLMETLCNKLVSLISQNELVSAISIRHFGIKKFFYHSQYYTLSEIGLSFSPFLACCCCANSEK